MKNRIDKKHYFEPDSAQRQLLLCLKAYITDVSAELVIDPQNAEETAGFFHLAYLHKLLPVVCDTLKPYDRLFASPAAAAYRRTAREQAVMQSYYSQSLCDTLAELKKRGFEPIVLKGEVCRRLYSGPALRISSDEDIYLPEGAGECARALMDMGYKGTAAFDENGVMALNSPDGLHVELHGRLFGAERLFAQAAAQLHGAAVADPAYYSGEGAEKIRAFAPTEGLLYLICHAAKHFTGGGVGVRTLGDIAAYSMRHYDKIDMRGLARMLKTEGLLSFTAGVFDIAEKYLGYDADRFPKTFLYTGNGEGRTGNTVPDNSIIVSGGAMLEDCLMAGVYGTSSMARAQSAKYTAGAASGKSMTGTGARQLFPGRDELEKEYPFVKKTALLLPAAWAARILKYIRSGRRDAQSGAQLARKRARLLKQYGLGIGGASHE